MTVRTEKLITLRPEKMCRTGTLLAWLYRPSCLLSGQMERYRFTEVFAPVRQWFMEVEVLYFHTVWVMARDVVTVRWKQIC